MILKIEFQLNVQLWIINTMIIQDTIKRHLLKFLLNDIMTKHEWIVPRCATVWLVAVIFCKLILFFVCFLILSLQLCCEWSCLTPFVWFYFVLNWGCNFGGLFDILRFVDSFFIFISVCFDFFIFSVIAIIIRSQKEVPFVCFWVLFFFFYFVWSYSQHCIIW